MSEKALFSLIEALTNKTKQKLANLEKLQNVLNKTQTEEQQLYLLIPRQIFCFKIGCFEEIEEHTVNFGEIAKYIKGCISRKIRKHQKTYKRLKKQMDGRNLTEKQLAKLQISSRYEDAKVKDITFTESKIICEINKPIIFSKKNWNFLDNYFIYQVY